MNNQDKSKPHQFTYFIIGTIAFAQGIMGLSDLAIQYMQKDDYLQTPSQTAFYSGIISLPWVIKPVWGIISDTIPLFGYRRKSYLLLFGTLAFMLWNVLAHYGIHNPDIGYALLIGINVCVAFCNVIGEALLVELSGEHQGDDDSIEQQQNLEVEGPQRAKPEQQNENKATSNVAFFFGMRSFGTMLTAYFSGRLLDSFDKKYIFMITSIFPLQLAFLSLFLKEKKVTRDQVNKIKTSESIAEICEFVSEPAIYKPILMIFLFVASPSVSTAMFYFYTNVLAFQPEFIGYIFDNNIQSELRLMYSISSILAVLLFNRFLKNVKFTKVFGYSTFFYCCVSWLTILLVERLLGIFNNNRVNVRWGIPDKVFCMGDGVLDQVVGELNTMPLLVFACKMCPKNIEGTMYALLMSTINFGALVSGQIGAVITYYMGVTDSDFTNLGILIFITSSCSLIPLPLLRIIKDEDIENAKINNQRRREEKIQKQKQLFQSNGRREYAEIENENEDQQDYSKEQSKEVQQVSNQIEQELEI